jgi:RNA polymerase sigma factor (sigma-70 family)
MLRPCRLCRAVWGVRATSEGLSHAHGARRRAGGGADAGGDAVRLAQGGTVRPGARQRASAAAWIFTIARNLRIDAARRAQLAPQAIDLSDERPSEPLADTILAAEDRARRVRDALAELSEQQAEVIRLFFFDERPHAEIERALGIPLGTVKSRLRLAMGRLRILLDDER